MNDSHELKEEQIRQIQPERKVNLHANTKREVAKRDTVTLTKTSLWKVVSGVFAVLLALAIFTGGFGFGGSNSKTAAIGAPSAPSAQSAPTINVDIDDLIDDDAVKGNSKAPVTIVEFGDFECPFCGRFHHETLGQIEDKYVKTGKVKFVYRDFPLSFHTQAQKAAEAAECAGEQGKFYEMHDLLFESGVQGGVSSFKQYAKQIGLDATKFNTCLDTGAMASEVQKDFADGQRVGVQGTPGFLINGKLVSGAQPFSVFQQVIEAELAR